MGLANSEEPTIEDDLEAGLTQGRQQGAPVPGRKRRSHRPVLGLDEEDGVHHGCRDPAQDHHHPGADVLDRLKGYAIRQQVRLECSAHASWTGHQGVTVDDDVTTTMKAPVLESDGEPTRQVRRDSAGTGHHSASVAWITSPDPSTIGGLRDFRCPCAGRGVETLGFVLHGLPSDSQGNHPRVDHCRHSTRGSSGGRGNGSPGRSGSLMRSKKSRRGRCSGSTGT